MNVLLPPEASLSRVLRRAGAIWHPALAAHQVIFGEAGSGKTTLIKSLLRLCPDERVLILDPGPYPDPVWDGPPYDPDAWGRPVAVAPMRGARGEGGGPCGQWFRLSGTTDRGQTARRFGDALDIVAAEGHCVLVLDGVGEITDQLKLAGRVDSVMNLGRAANVRVILSAAETSYLAGRAPAAITWVGHTSGPEAASAGAGLLGWRETDSQDICAAVAPHEWIFSEDQPGSAGPVLIRPNGVSR